MSDGTPLESVAYSEIAMNDDVFAEMDDIAHDILKQRVADLFREKIDESLRNVFAYGDYGPPKVVVFDPTTLDPTKKLWPNPGGARQPYVMKEEQ